MVHRLRRQVLQQGLQQRHVVLAPPHEQQVQSAKGTLAQEVAQLDVAKASKMRVADLCEAKHQVGST